MYKGKAGNGFPDTLSESLRVECDPELCIPTGFPRDDRKTGYLPIIVGNKDFRASLLPVLVEPPLLPESVVEVPEFRGIGRPSPDDGDVVPGDEAEGEHRSRTCLEIVWFSIFYR